MAVVKKTAAVLTVEQLEQRFRKLLVSGYLIREHSEINMAPKERWEALPFVPRIPDSSQQLELLLLTVTKPRRARGEDVTTYLCCLASSTAN
jgi:putative transposase